jgi:multiple sugar transport system permease protein
MMATTIKKGILYIALTALAVICILPFVLTIINSTRDGR